MDNQFTQKVSDIIMYSKEEANRLGNSYIGPEHLMLGLLRDGESKAIEILNNLDINLRQLKKEIESLLKNESNNISTDKEIMFNEKATIVLKLSIHEARLMQSPASDVEHILLAIMKSRNTNICRLLEGHDINYDKVFNELSVTHEKHSVNDYYGDEDDDDLEMPPSKKDSSEIRQSSRRNPNSSNETPMLDSYGIDLTKAALEEKLDRVIGREKEIERIAQILGRRKKNNPILIGEPGVGKSAIVEGLALNITKRKVSRTLFNKKIVTLDMTSVVAGTKYRGQFEERIKEIINELKSNPNIILFIDEIHTIIGAGGASGSMDAANILKPALARGEIQCIGATTLDEYRESIEKDGALERRFQKIIVEPTTAEETLKIVTNIKDKYEEHHNVTYTDAALQACVKLSDRYITDRFFPDKAIDVLDEAGSRALMGNITVPKEIEQQENLIIELQNKKNEAVKLQNFELAASFRDKEKEATEKLEMMKIDWENEQKEHRQTVDEEDIANIVSLISGIPVQRMAQAEGLRLIKMKDNLLGNVIGQDKAIETVVKAIQRNRVGLKDPNKPIGTFMFLGPTGVGKTYLAKELAKYMFGSTDALIRIDMSEYMEKFTVSRLIGSPPGYVGYEEGGQLTERVRRKPYSIVLLDEIEKAHGDVFNILLHVMDEGRLTDSSGRTVDFKNTVIIMTSNVGTRQLKEFNTGIGFNASISENEKEHAHSIINKALNKHFAPEFLNRIDEIINFDQLDLESLIKIIDLELKGLIDRMKNLGYEFVVDEESKKFMAEIGYDKQYGARPLKRTIQTYLEDKLSEVVLLDKFKPGDKITTSFDSENKVINIIINE